MNIISEQIYHGNIPARQQTWADGGGAPLQKPPGEGEDGQPGRAVCRHQHSAVSGEGLHQRQRQEQSKASCQNISDNIDKLKSKSQIQAQPSPKSNKRGIGEFGLFL